MNLSFPAKLALALVSASSHWLMSFLADRSAAFDEFLSTANFGLHIVGILFGALVMAPYVAAPDRRILRIIAMCVASAAIYYAAVRFVVDGPFIHSTIAPFLISGTAAALLVGLATAWIAPRRPSALLVALTVVAGAVGGSTFDWSFGGALESAPIAGHYVWQLLVCVALHFGFRKAT